MFRTGQFIPLTKLPRNLGCFDYQINEELSAQIIPGQIIKIRFGKRQLWACFVGLIDKSNFENIKTIERVETLTTLDSFQLAFLQWFSSYYYYSLGSTLKLMQPEAPLKTHKNIRSKDVLKIESKILFEKNIQASKIAREIIAGSQNKYWLANYNDAAKWSLYLELIKLSKKQLFILFPSVTLAQSFFAALPVDVRNTACLAIGDSMKTKNRAYQIWSDINENKVKLIVGTRSTCFYLTKDIGIIIIDSADSEDYKQWDQAPFYDAVTVLQQSQNLIGNKLIITTTQPRVEDTYVFKKEKYQYIALGSKVKLNVAVVDMKKEQKRKHYFLSFQAEEALENCIENNKQALLIVNKIGLFSKLVCSDCGFEAVCEKCDLPLSINEQHELECRHCKITSKILTSCPKCGNIKLQGRGAGLTQIKNELAKTYTCSEDFGDIKTQIILSTGQSIPGLAADKIGAVIFVYFDSLIYLTDFNSNYRLYSFVQNIIRGVLNQQVVIQTHFPDNEVFKYINSDYALLYRNEITAREDHNYPPFCTLAKLFFQHHDKKICSNEAERLYLELLPKIKAVGGSITDPYLYYLNKIRKRYRYILTIKLPPMSLDQENKLLASVPDFWSIDKNPTNLL